MFDHISDENQISWDDFYKMQDTAVALGIVQNPVKHLDLMELQEKLQEEIDNS
ncbi:hypothetical protein ACJA23_03005 [Mycoplasma corogypsi]|uniref:hypothetical protein n=1 Tax=Mycoplasma corogypsi TaxID=2106 RepID=UPI003873A507